MDRVAICLILFFIAGTAAADRTYQYCQPLLAQYEAECTDQNTLRDETKKAMCAAYEEQIAKDCATTGRAGANESSEEEDS